MGSAETENHSRRGRLIYIVGPSGSGKDTIISYVRERLAVLSTKTIFSHRYITRPAAAGGENHIEISAWEFENREKAGLFALSWHIHGLSYGIGIELECWLAQGFNVVVNGSRGYLGEARKRYPDLLLVSIDVSRETLRERLVSRGRESIEEIEKRLERAASYATALSEEQHIINNDGLPGDAGQQLLTLILTAHQPS